MSRKIYVSNEADLDSSVIIESLPPVPAPVSCVFSVETIAVVGDCLTINGGLLSSVVLLVFFVPK